MTTRLQEPLPENMKRSGLSKENPPLLFLHPWWANSLAGVTPYS